MVASRVLRHAPPGPRDLASIANFVNAKAEGVKGDGSTQDAGRIQALIEECRTASDGTAEYLPYFPPGNYLINDEVWLERQYGLGMVGAGPRLTRFIWNGAAGGRMLRVSGVREAALGGFQLYGDGATVGLTYDAVAGGLVSTGNEFERIDILNHAYGMRVGESSYQTDQSTFRRMRFRDCTVAGVSIEDANAVAHDFYDCVWEWCRKGITAILHGDGGHYNLFGAFFLKGSDYDMGVYPSNRGTKLSGYSERGALLLQVASSSTATQVTLDDWSVNGLSYQETYTPPGSGTFTLTYKGQTTGALAWNATAATVQAALVALSTVGSSGGRPNMRVHGGEGSPFVITRDGALESDVTALTASGGTVAATEHIINFGSSGALKFNNGKYQALLSGRRFEMRIGGNNNRRTNVIVDGTTFDGDPFASNTNMDLATVILRGVQVRNVGDITTNAGAAEVNGKLAYGSLAAPRLLSEAMKWQGAIWYRIPSGTALTAGVNTFTGSSWQVRGLTTITATIHKFGGLTQPAMIRAYDDNATLANQFKVEVVVGSGFTLTSDLVFKVEFEPEFCHY
jgi:hypothetical protein